MLLPPRTIGEVNKTKRVRIVFIPFAKTIKSNIKLIKKPTTTKVVVGLICTRLENKLGSS